MNDDELTEEVASLISDRSEGGYWDFKTQWPVGADLLHDIICMANNLEDRDAYIIIGVDEANDFAVVGVENDQHRRNVNELTTFLRDKKFLGGMRPTVRIRTFNLDGKQVDVVIVSNTTFTPYLVTADFTDPPAGSKKPRAVRANSIYTRIQDTNTPIDQTADLDKIEYLWRKRFGLGKTALQRLAILLDSPENWTYDDVRSRFFYQYAPEFVLQIENSYLEEENREFREAHKRSEFYCKLFPDSDGYYWEDFAVTYHQTVIYDGICAYLDGGRHLIAIPDRALIRAAQDHSNTRRYALLYFYDSSSLLGKINRLFATHYSHGSDAMCNPLDRSIVTFQDSSEKDAFIAYLCENLPNLDNVQTLEKLEKNHGGRGGDWPDIVEQWEQQTMEEFGSILDEWRVST